MNWKNKNVLVTGAGGFIGLAVAERLITEGANVTALLKSHAVKPMGLFGATMFVGNVTDYKLMSDIISSQEIEYIFHFAANAIVRIGARDPMSTYDTNVMGTLAVLEAARNVGKTIKKILVASSDKAYGDHEVLPYTEEMALQPRNTYDTSKACADLVARSYAHNYSMPVVVTRCSNVYGPGDPNNSRIVPNSILRILDGEPPVLYSDVSVMEREFIYIDDVVEACLMLASSDERTDGEAYNVGGTGARSVEDVVKTILLLMGADAQDPVIVQRESIFKEIQRQYIDAKKLVAVTGWQPKVSLVPGLKNTIAWYKAERERNR